MKNHSRHTLAWTVLGLASVFSSIAMAQPKASFQESEISLGNIGWHTQALAHINLKNTGNRPLYITQVETDCGCTVVSWNHSAVAPGSSTVIDVTYDAETLGTFGRTVSVTTNADTEPFDILLTGRVQTEVHDYSREFPYRIDDVLLSVDQLEFDDVNLGDHPEQTILVMNNGQKPYAPEFMHLPKYLSVTSQPEVLRPGRIGRVTFILDSNQLPTMGLTQSNIYVARYPGDKVRKAAEMGVSATLLPQLDEATLHSANHPVVVIPSTINLGKGIGKKRLKGSVVLENQGTADLHIRALQVYNPGISVSLSKSILRPGERATLKVNVSTATGNFKGRRRVLIITDDPNRQKVTVDVIAE